jgi:hypothetical protein
MDSTLLEWVTGGDTDLECKGLDDSRINEGLYKVRYPNH